MPPPAAAGGGILRFVLAVVVAVTLAVVATYLSMVQVGIVGPESLDQGELVSRLEEVDEAAVLRSTVRWLGLADLEAVEQLDLRGVVCRYNDDNELVHCYDQVTLERCPPFVDPIYLSQAAGHDMCQPWSAATYFCSVRCTPEGGVDWLAHSVEWCGQYAQTLASCVKDSRCCPSRSVALAHEDVLDMKMAVGGRGFPTSFAPPDASPHPELPPPVREQRPPAPPPTPPPLAPQDARGGRGGAAAEPLPP